VCCVCGGERRLQGLLGANSTSTAFTFVWEILARKMGGKGDRGSSVDPLVWPNYA
jgi:hypothetical protein